MNYLSAEDLQISFGDRVLFSGISFGIAQGQKIALVGVNGSGKSTLLRMLAGEEVPEKGEVATANGIRIAWLPQLPEFDPQARVLDAVMQSDDPVISLVREYEHAMAESAETGNSERLTRLIGEMDAQNAWNYEAQVKEILGKLGIHQLDQKIGNLSGGQRKRVGIARALLQQPDLVILDEPTNHLDLDAIEWLEDYLSTSNMAIIMVTHDRYFLENVTNEIFELEGGNLYQYQGNYSYYLEKKNERRHEQQADVEKSRNLMRKELEWIRRQPKARGTKAKYRIDAFEELKQKANQQISENRLEVDVVRRRQGGKILELHEVGRSFDGVPVVRPFSYIFRKGEKLGIVGPNGAGKSTFLNLLSGRVEPDHGKVVRGETTVIGYYEQTEPVFDDALRVIEIVQEVTDLVTLSDGSKVSASQMLNRFHFPPKKQHDKVGKLSGGEKRRLQLLLVLLNNPNFLILDEPTNDLDLDTLRVLEEFLAEFQGCLVLVSHDRYFMDRLVDHMFVFEAGREIRDFNGKYSEYRAAEDQRRQEEARQAEATPEPRQAVRKDRPEKLSFKEKREMEKLEAEMEKINEQLAALTNELNAGGLNHEELAAKGSRMESLRLELDEKEMRWLELSEKET